MLGERASTAAAAGLWCLLPRVMPLEELGAVGFGSAHLAVELFVVGASITFSRALESVVRGGGHSELAGA